MIQALANILSLHRAAKIESGMRVNQCLPLSDTRTDGVVVHLDDAGRAFVEWPQGGSGWVRADQLHPIAD